uniref:hypothetical protein n=1 Tax=Methylobacterium sp. B34 TaxID=95563 RepID=UPI001650D9D1
MLGEARDLVDHEIAVRDVGGEEFLHLLFDIGDHVLADGLVRDAIGDEPDKCDLVGQHLILGEVFPSQLDQDGFGLVDEVEGLDQPVRALREDRVAHLERGDLALKLGVELEGARVRGDRVVFLDRDVRGHG